MNKIIAKEQLSATVVKLVVEAPMIAKSYQAGQFAIVRYGEKGERIPLTICESDVKNGTISLVVASAGKTTSTISSLNAGEFLTDVTGPLGQAANIPTSGTVLCYGSDSNIAYIYPIIKASKAAGCKVIAILDGDVILEKEIKECCDIVANKADLNNILENGGIDRCFVSASATIMKEISECTTAKGIPTEVALYAIMVDGTGMCGACRLTIGGKTRFVCVEGPLFDATQVNFDEVTTRLKSY
ncbi:MAG: sulfide/dihydroorotate dehydrogenase-like FAD/NAD-binding protein [Bacteroidales bacterium]|nr:sulfide/dihydroorotate dehydrogenase-like FAD/NAD-binding protein [Candidatus Sodaliphilus aphodohippi]